MGSLGDITMVDQLPPTPGASPPPVTATGWGFLKVLGLIFALLVMVGFGICGLCGVLIAMDDARYRSDALMLSGIGFAIAIAFFFVVRAILRSGRKP